MFVRSRGFALALTAVVGLGTAVRFDRLGTPSLWLDEILGVLGAGPEHGPVYYVLMRHPLPGVAEDAAVRVPFALAGGLSIAAAGTLGARMLSPLSGIAAAGVLALSPAHVHYSREARPYMLLVLGWCAAALAWEHVLAGRRRVAAAATFAAVVAAMVFTSSLSIFYLASLLVFVVGRRRGRADAPRHVSWTILAGTFVVSAAAFAWLYGAVRDASPGGTNLNAVHVWRMLHSLVGAHADTESVRAGALAAGAMLVGAALASRREQRAPVLALLGAALAGALLPMAVFAVRDRWMASRYLLSALPPLALLLGHGLANVAALPASVTGRLLRRETLPARQAGAATLALLLAATAPFQWPAIQKAQWTKADWRAIAELVAAHAHDTNTVIASSGWSELCLGYYLHRIGSGVRVMSANESLADAKTLAAQAGHAFLIAGGFHRDPAVGLWMGQFPSLFSSPIEAINLTFYPDRAAFLRYAALRREHERYEGLLWNTMLGRLDFGPNSEPFLLDGWSDPESNRRAMTFRWAIGRRSRIYLPAVRRASAEIRLSLTPLDAVADRQRLTLRFNDTVVGAYQLTRGWQDIVQPLELGLWRAGANILDMEFSASERASVVDDRDLAVAFSALVLQQSAPVR